MPGGARKKKPKPTKPNKQEIKEIFDTLNKEKNEEIRNTQLDVKYQNLERDRIKLEEFRRKIENKKSEYSTIHINSWFLEFDEVGLFSQHD